MLTNEEDSYDFLVNFLDLVDGDGHCMTDILPAAGVFLPDLLPKPNLGLGDQILFVQSKASFDVQV